MTNIKHSIPGTPEEWLKEIAKAYNDAIEAIPFSSVTGHKITEDNLFHLAPSVCLKFRNIERTKKNLKKATYSAISSYVATKDINEILSIPILSFAFCYLASHLGLDILDEETIVSLMEYIEKEQKTLIYLISLSENQ